MTVLQITNGTVTANLIWHNTLNTKYLLTRGDWAPSIAALRRSELAQGGMYSDVQEEIVVNVYGQSTAECLDNLARLAYLLDQADRWNPARGENVPAVRLQYTPTGGSELWECVIVGRAEGDETAGVQLPPTFNRDLGAYIIEGVRLRFRRRGLWLAPAETSTTSSSTSTGATVSVSWPSAHDTTSPVDVYINGLSTPGSDGPFPAGVLLVADATNHLITYNAASLWSGSSPWSQVNDASSNPYPNQIQRYTPVATSIAETSFNALTGWDTTVRRVDVWAVLRNNSTNRTYRVQIQSSPQPGTSGVGLPLAEGPWVTIGPENNNPQLVFLGTLIYRGGHQRIKLRVQVDTTSGSGTLDINYITLHARDNDACHAIANLGSEFGLLQPAATYRVAFEHRLLEEPNGRVFMTSQTVEQPIGYAGSIVLPTRGSTLVVAWLATGSYYAPNQNYWRYTETSLASFTISAVRRRAERTPR